MGAGGGGTQDRGPGAAPGASASTDGSGRRDVRAPVGHELRTGWAGTPTASNGALRALDLYA
jgi:hypothetical protein